VGVNRVRFLLDALADLDASLRKLDSRLFVLQGTPHDVLPGLFKQVPWPLAHAEGHAEGKRHAHATAVEV
jgi:deoxyribodipyrimidine photolyase